MATWQFDCAVVPRAATAREGFDREDPGIWRGHSAAAIRAAFAALGEPSPTWAKTMVMWGSENGTCLYLMRVGDDDLEMDLRIDMRRPSDPLIHSILSIARTLDLVVVALTTGEVLDPTTEAVMGAAKVSPAAQFVADPARFLSELRRP